MRAQEATTPGTVTASHLPPPHGGGGSTQTHSGPVRFEASRTATLSSASAKRASASDQHGPPAKWEEVSRAPHTVAVRGDRRSSAGISSWFGSLRDRLFSPSEEEPSCMSTSADPKPRVVRHAINQATTSMLEPSAIVSEIHRVLNHFKIAFHHHAPFCISFTTKGISMEMEVCQVPGVSNTYFIRMKRIAGAWMGYKTLAAQLIEKLKL